MRRRYKPRNRLNKEGYYWVQEENKTILGVFKSILDSETDIGEMRNVAAALYDRFSKKKMNRFTGLHQEVVGDK